MTINKRKKNSRARGTNSHGWGAKKKHRGAGHRGGRGNAGTGKRADSKKPSINPEKYFGKHGFAPKNSRLINSANLNYLEMRIDTLVKNGIAKLEKETYIIDLDQLKIHKLLSKGKITKKFQIKVKYATSRAIEKIKKLGGDVILEQLQKSNDAKEKSKVELKN